MTMVDDAVRSRDEDFVRLRLIERNTALERYAMTIIARPTSQRSSCRLKGRRGIVIVEVLFIIGVSLIEELRSHNEYPSTLNELILSVTKPEYPLSTVSMMNDRVTGWLENLVSEDTLRRFSRMRSRGM